LVISRISSQIGSKVKEKRRGGMTSGVRLATFLSEPNSIASEGWNRTGKFGGKRKRLPSLLQSPYGNEWISCKYSNSRARE
jgi:hypothetical protein